MSTVEAFKVQVRTQTGGGASRSLRRSGMIPGILYGGDKENVPLMVDPRDVEKGLRHSSFYSKIFELDVNGEKERTLARAVQLHPVTDRPLHIDFWRVGKNTKIHVSVPLHFLNENKCPGIKQGGLLNIVLHALEVTCSADNIPEHLTIDLSDMEMGATIHADILQLPEGVSITHPDRDYTLATIVAPKLAQEGSTGASGEKSGAASSKA